MPDCMDPPQSQSANRKPKLRYRTSTGDTDASETTTINMSKFSVSTKPTTSPTQSERSLSPRYTPSHTTASSISTAPSVAGSASLPPHTSDQPLKKRQSFFSGLFTVKEPSAQALANYQKELMRSGPGKSGRMNAVGMPGVSSATLPPKVPKVNSKWDGIPRSVKDKDTKKSSGSRSSTLNRSRDASTVSSERSSRGSSVRTSHSRRPHSRGTLGGASTYTNGSGGSRNHLADLYGWEITDFSGGAPAKNDSVELPRPGTSGLTSDKSAPALQSKTSVASDILPPPGINNNHVQEPPGSASVPPHPPAHLPSPSVSSPNSLPPEPNTTSTFIGIPGETSQKTLQKLQAAPQEDLRLTAAQPPVTTDQVVVRSSGINILGPPSSAKRAQVASPTQPKAEEAPQTSAYDTTPRSILKKASSTPKNDGSPSQSPGSSGRPQRSHSVRERLGLGVHLRNNDVAPWELSELADPSEFERMLTPTPENGGRPLRRKGRTSLFKR
ncbi:MAG: hypothetical protein Q9163_002644 [Psora crenata]